MLYWQDGGDGTDEVESWRQMIGVLEELEACCEGNLIVQKGRHGQTTPS